MALEGDLKDFSLTDLINLVIISKRKGALVFHPYPGDEWSIYFDEKGVIHAEHGENEGEKILERLLILKSGPFIFNPNKITSNNTITKSHEELSMYLSVLGDIWNEIKDFIPPLDTDLVVESDYSEIVLSSLELKMLLLVATRVKMKAILDEEGKVGIKELEALIHLIRAGIVRPGSPSPVKKAVSMPTTDAPGIKLTVVKSFSISKDMVQMDKNIANNWVENNLFTGRVFIRGTIFIAELKTGLGKALVIADKSARTLGLKEGEEVEVKPYFE
ncbi:MAG: hypothetical protein DDT40_00077 [candidate division WS2 bacterium]|uniref:PatA-like N-terminal domain-containing protein n=1 Tax=Psychracetigena formicireducens TaxID=2986056 RepID=A0A9E2BJI6_PSYF1|nr:hypothetical protein [Candidatus Psychracetigena formicireducens]MBT9144249.1 hypothetical protein [Candidatus Psychracetigena formicireducens]MBT9149911.1 hypothetical protein [Candidatus Psychracetigena formicireducens]